MPIARTSSSTGSRVLYKANNNSSRTSVGTPSPGLERQVSRETGLEVEGNPRNSSYSYFITPSSQGSNSSSSKMKRFPSILSKKDKNDKQGSKRASSGGGNERVPSGHTRSVSLASAPSNLPRPSAASTTSNNPPLPTSTSQPVMTRPSTATASSNPSSPSGIPQAKRIVPPSGSLPAAAASNAPTSTSTPTTAVQSGATSPSRIPALSTSSGRGVPVSAGQFTLNGHAKTQSDVTGSSNPFGFRGNSIYGPPQQIQNSQTSRSSVDRKIGEAETAASTVSQQDTPGRNTPTGLPRSASAASGIPRLRNFSDPTGPSAEGIQSSQQQPDSSTVTNARPMSREPSVSEQSAGARSAISEGGSRISQSRGPLPTPPSAPTTQAHTSSASEVPAMWRTSSYEGSTKAYLSTSASMGRNLSGSSTGTAAESVQGKNTYIGLSGLEDLETKYKTSVPEQAGAVREEDKLAENRDSTLAIENRIRLLRKLVDLRGPRVLDGQDIEKIVWLEGTNLHMSSNEELAMARNGSVMTNTTASPPLGSTTTDVAGAAVSSSPLQSVKSSDPLPAVPAQPPKEKKQGLFQKMAATFGGGGSSPDKGHARKPSTGATSTTGGGETTSGLAKSGSAGQLATEQTSANTATAAAVGTLSQAQQKAPPPSNNRGPIFGVKISDAPPLAYAVSIIGGQRHQLPILVFSLVEAIFRRGIDTSGIFRMNGDPAAISRLIEGYNSYPTYGDDINLEKETIFTLCDLLKRYLKDMPEPVLSKELWNLFVSGCLLSTRADEDKEHVRKLAAAQIVFRLLPRKNMSLLIYLTAFLFQLPLHPSNRLTIESISVIFGPAVMAPRTSSDASQMGNTIERNTRRSQEGLKWLLDNWDDSLSQDLLDEEYDPLSSPIMANGAWSGGATEDEGEGSAEASSESIQGPKIQYSPQKMTVVQNPMNSPAFSMAASPMVQNFSEQSRNSATTADGSPVPEGWGEAISPSEDSATLQRQLHSSRARKSSFDLDPEISSPTKSQFGHVHAQSGSASGLPQSEIDGKPIDMAYAPVGRNEVDSETRIGEARMSPVVEAEEAFSEKPRSLKSVKSSRSLRSQRVDGAPFPDGYAPLPGAMPIKSPLPVADPPSELTPRPQASRELEPLALLSQNSEDRAPRTDSGTSASQSGVPEARDNSPETTASDAGSTHKRASSSLATSVRDSQTPKSYPLQGRKEGLNGEEGRSSSTFGGNRNNSYSARPISYARSEVNSEMGSHYVPEELNSDPNAARLFGSLGELFMSEKRKVTDYQQQMRQLEARQADHEEVVAGLQRQVNEHESRGRSLQRDVDAAKEAAASYGDALEKAHAEQAKLEANVAALQSQLKDGRNRHASTLAEQEASRTSERNGLLAEIASMRHQLDTSISERNAAQQHLESIRSVLNSAAR